jgi:hypothetical protein
MVATYSNLLVFSYRVITKTRRDWSGLSETYGRKKRKIRSWYWLLNLGKLKINKSRTKVKKEKIE